MVTRSTSSWSAFGLFAILLCILALMDVASGLGHPFTTLAQARQLPVKGTNTSSYATCNFSFHSIDAACPRFVDVNFGPGVGPGLGDRFLQYLVGLVYAIRTEAFLLNVDNVMGVDSPHGNYSWAPDFFKLNFANANVTLSDAQRMYPNLTVIDHPAGLSKNDFEERIVKLRDQCYTLLRVDWADCVENSCYFAHDPRLYEEAHHILACYFIHTNREELPELIYDGARYNVFIHIRVGDVVLYDEAHGGVRFFEGLKLELDQLLSDTFPVHYYFFAEAPLLPEDEADPYRRPPPGFAFLESIFDRNQPLQRVSYVKDMDVRATIYHEMNADMVVTTGSSFPLVAVTVSPKPIVIFAKTKEGQHFPVYLRHDYALVDDDGHIFKPSASQLKAHIIMRFAEVHERVVPYV